MKNIIRELQKGKNVPDNLKKFVAVAMETNQAYSGLELTFSAYTLVEEMQEEKQELAVQEKESLQCLLTGLRQLSEAGGVDETLMEEMKQLRTVITDKMDLFTAYVDRLICYEYILNRKENDYLPPKELNKRLSGIDENAFMQRMSRYLFGGADQGAMQEKIRLVIGQVPIQMTSGKFYEKIKEALTLYKGSEKKSLDDFVYVLRTSGMLYEPKEKIDYYGTFAEEFQRLEEADYANLSESEYKELTDVLARTSAQIHALTDFYYSMQKVVNHIYTQCVLRPYQKEETKLDAACRSIWKCLSNGEYRPEMMIPLEGKIEKEVENVNQLESVLYEIKASYSKEMDEQGLRQSFDDLVTVSNLMSDSLFIDLNQMNDEELVDEAYVMQTAEKLIQEFSEKMKKTSRPLKRAIMGEVIEKLPMIFKSQQEVLDYIQNNLFGCQNKAEKCVVLSILDDLMREEEEWS